MSATPSAGPATYIDRRRLPFPFCPGCGHGRVLEALDIAMVRLGRDPRRIVVVTDIGCVGLSDQYLVTNGLHGLHGRSVTYATGIKLADPDLLVLVLIGDGGCGIGGNHLLHAARRNVGIAVVVFNNLNFGMTGGQLSPLTPPGAVTSNTPAGNLEAPMDLCATVAVNGAAFAARTDALDPALPDLLHEALATEGFALVDVWELCTAYFVPHNRFSRQALQQTMRHLGLPSGVVARRSRPEYSRALRAQAGGAGGEALRALIPRWQGRLERTVRLVVAGAAGQKVRSAASALGRAGVLCGLYATQRDDYPVTVMTGHSISELILSPQPVGYTGIPAPDVLVVLAPEGLSRAKAMATRMEPDGRIYAEESLAGPLSAVTRASLRPLRTGRVPGRRSVALAAVALVAEREGWLPVAALEESVRDGPPGVVDEAQRAIAARGLLEP